jgi:predicted nucleotidyltransferase
MNPTIQPILRELGEALKVIYGARMEKALLFGSYARSQAEEGSDIDVLVVLDGPVHPSEEIARTEEAVASLSLKWDRVISCAFVSRERYQNENSPLLINVRNEGVAL